ncbi:MAG TPA: M48 family metallopeptidase, partial [Candidatus Acidoferrum sp.]|nr:M48 family metallopeptidase [Candidatus Acidoferrum sp.]
MPIPRVAIRPRRSIALFAILTILMVVVSYAFMVLLAVACVYLPYLVVSFTHTGQGVLLLLGGAIVAATMLVSLLPRLDKFTPPGLRLDRSSQPGLFTELDGIAAALDEPLPRDVYLIGDVNAWVADRGGVLGVGSRRVMGLGLPLLSIL